MTDPARTAIVTGGSRGVGRRITEVLAADGVRVLLSQRALPHLVDGGRIVALTSYGSIRAFPATARSARTRPRSSPGCATWPRSSARAGSPSTPSTVGSSTRIRCSILPYTATGKKQHFTLKEQSVADQAAGRFVTP